MNLTHIKKLIVCLLLAVGTAHSAKAQSDQIAFFDNFDSNKNKWDELNSSSALLMIKQGRYYVEHKEQRGGWATAIKIDYADNKDFVIETSLYKSYGVNNHGYGLVWDWKDQHNYKAFQISSDGHFQITQTRGGKISNLVNWTKTESINKRLRPNVLQIHHTDSKLLFFVNGIQVWETKKDNIRGNSLGFVVNHNIRMRVDYLLVRYP